MQKKLTVIIVPLIEQFVKLLRASSSADDNTCVTLIHYLVQFCKGLEGVLISKEAKTQFVEAAQQSLVFLQKFVTKEELQSREDINILRASLTKLSL